MRFGPTPHELSATDCWRLLGATGMGRLSVTLSALPAIVPVRYEVGEGLIVVCLGDRPELTAAVNDTVVALSHDSFGPEDDHGWFVQVQGLAHLDGTASPGDGTPSLRATLEPSLLSGATYRRCPDC